VPGSNFVVCVGNGLFRSFTPLLDRDCTTYEGVMSAMKRKDFIKASAMLIGAVAAPGTVHAATDDAALLKQTVADYYRIFFIDVDQEKYRALLTDDYLLLEHGDIQDTEKDISFMPKPADEYRRTDAFDFKSLKIHGDTAYVVYFLKSDIRSKKDGAIKREWLESMILRRGNGGRWRVALLHSTKLMKA
jgi:ketosteroid isomerase-like protein